MFQEWRGQTFGRMIDYSIRQWPDRVAIRETSGTKTYSELGRRIDELEQGLRAIGVTNADHIGHLMGADSDWVELFFASMQIGATLVPFNLLWTEDELRTGLQLTDVTTLVVAEQFRDSNLTGRIRDTLPDLKHDDEGGATSDYAPSLKRVIYVPAGAHGATAVGISLDAIRLRGSGRTKIAEDVEVAPHDQALLLLTSGTTAFPKPAIHTHESMLAGICGYADGLEATVSDRFLHTTPNYHVGGIITMCIPLLRGGSSHLMGHFDPAVALRRIKEEQITLLWGFDTHFTMLRDEPAFHPDKLRSVSRTMAASNPAAYDNIRAMGITHHGSLYGSTEYMGSQTFFPYRDRHDVDRMKHSNGRAMTADLRIIDPVTGRRCKADVPGEICVRGPALFNGYYKMADETRACIDDDGFFHSGDYGWLDDNGYLYYRGRYKEIIKSGGENVSAAEVELTIAALPGVTRAVVVGLPHPKWGESVTALVELAPDADVTSDEIRELCRDRIAGYKIPKAVVLVQNSDWVITPTGKLDKRAAQRLAAQRIERSE